MESAAVLRSFNCSVSSVPHVQSILKRSSMVAVHNVSWPTLSKSQAQASALVGKLDSSPIRREGMIVSCAKTFETNGATMSDAPLFVQQAENHNGAVSSDGIQQGSHEKNPLPRATFPSGFEEVITEVCDETEIAELKLKVGDFEMHLKRNIGALEVPMGVNYHTTHAPVSSSPTIESALASPPPPLLPPSPPQSPTEKLNLSARNLAKLAQLEASGLSGYVFVKSTQVGSMQKCREKKQPPICKVGSVIREGQLICFVDQFGSRHPVRSDVAGEVLMVLFREGEAVGYGDPILVVLPSFHNIKIK